MIFVGISRADQHEICSSNHQLKQWHNSSSYTYIEELQICNTSIYRHGIDIVTTDLGSWFLTLKLYDMVKT